MRTAHCLHLPPRTLLLPLDGQLSAALGGGHAMPPQNSACNGQGPAPTSGLPSPSEGKQWVYPRQLSSRDDCEISAK
eukprot:11976152-Alexandrium_andersonii.AAC.1